MNLKELAKIQERFGKAADKLNQTNLLKLIVTMAYAQIPNETQITFASFAERLLIEQESKE